MGLSNLPPGVTDSMLPGNRPEDIAFDDLCDWLADINLSVEEIKQAVLEKLLEVPKHEHENTATLGD